MKYFAPVKSYIPQAIIPFGSICYIVWFLIFEKSWNFSRLADKEALWVGALTITTMCILFSYAVLKRLRIPLIEVNDYCILINETMRPEIDILWSTILSLEKHWFFGYRLVCVGKKVSIPIGLLRNMDREKLVLEINSKIEKAHNEQPASHRFGPKSGSRP